MHVDFVNNYGWHWIYEILRDHHRIKRIDKWYIHYKTLQQTYVLWGLPVMQNIAPLMRSITHAFADLSI